MRRTPIARRSVLARSVRPTVPPELRDQLKIRSGGLCEARLPGCTGHATDVCHRIARKMGGRTDEFHRLSNAWHGCRACHRWATANPAQAYELGLALTEWREPTEEPIAYRHVGFVLLSDDGTLWSFGGAA